MDEDMDWTDVPHEGYLMLCVVNVVMNQQVP